MVKGNWTHCWIPEAGKAGSDVGELMPGLLRVNAICEGQGSNGESFPANLEWTPGATTSKHRDILGTGLISMLHLVVPICVRICI